jgi:cell division protein FtsA
MNIPPIAALEVGTSKVRVVVGEAREDGQIMITGFGEAPSRGIRKSDVIDFDNALSCVRRALQLADQNGPVKIHEVHLVLSGSGISCEKNRGTVPVEDDAGEIGNDDMDRCMETARAVNLGHDRQVVHTICQRFYIDEHHVVTNPMGMEGSRLSADTLVVHGMRAQLRNTVKVVRSVPMVVEDVAFGGLCAALAVLTPEEKEKGVLLIDLGGGTTDCVVYAHHAIAWAGSLAVGGDHVTNDVARGLQVTIQEAEQLKETNGQAMVDFSLRSKKVPVPSNVRTTDHIVPLIDLHTIIHLRMEETLQLVKESLLERELGYQLGAGVVLVGGGAKLKDICGLASKVFNAPCRIGKPSNVSGLVAQTESPEFAATLGMVRYGFSTAKKETMSQGWRQIVNTILRRRES